ncbi:dynein heavy chain 2, axonemal [Trichonephila clavipes]|nr:dynein heavy chain 2, axonemal [Trichonephila clavipes]
MIVCLDDFDHGECDKFGSQSALELLYMSINGAYWYDREKWTLNHLQIEAHKIHRCKGLEVRLSLALSTLQVTVRISSAKFPEVTIDGDTTYFLHNLGMELKGRMDLKVYKEKNIINRNLPMRKRCSMAGVSNTWAACDPPVPTASYPSAYFDKVPEPLLNQFCVINILPPQESHLKHIFFSLLKKRFSDSNIEIRRTLNAISLGSLSTFKSVRQIFLPTPSKLHYLFGLKDVKKVTLILSINA